MQKKITKYNNLVKLFTIFLLLSFLFGCSTGLVVTSKPTIHYFTSSPSTIESGESSTLSWNVTDATSVTIDQGIGPVELSSGTRSVSPTTTTTYTLTATNSAGSVTATTKVVANPPIKTITIQPGPSYGKDAYVKSTHQDENFNEEILLVGRQGQARMKTYIQFDLSFIPDNAVITDAILRLYQYDLWGSGTFSIGAYTVTEDWKEDKVTSHNRPEALTKPEHTTTIITKPIDGKWIDWHIGDLVNGWLDGSIKNYGVLLKAVDEDTINTFASFRASEYSYPSERPKLVIHYHIP